MATNNYISSANRSNVIFWSYSTKIANFTDRKTSSRAAHAEGTSLNNLGVGVTTNTPFTILA